MRNIGPSFFIFLLFIAIFSTSSRELALSNNSNTSLLNRAEVQYVQDLENVNRSIGKLTEACVLYDSKELQINDLKIAIGEVRKSFKKVEFLIHYFEPSLVVQYINGAPLPKVEPHVPEIVILEPKGLQILDELIYLNPDESAQILALSSELQKVWMRTLEFQRNKKFQHRYLLEAIRLGVVRIFSLGLTGFDTPGSANGLEESKVAWKSLIKYLELYENLGEVKAKKIYQRIMERMAKGSDYLNRYEDFDSFPRTDFLKEIIHPIYRDILRFHQHTGIELRHEADPTLYPINYMSEDYFSSSFFNASYYTQIAEEDLSDPNIIELGKTLFFDPALSKNVDMSCASCHNPQMGFTDGMALSTTSKDDITTSRNSMTLINSAYYDKYFWDMREYDLERQIKHVAHNELEFDMDLIDMADRLKMSEEYVNLFKTAYGERDKYQISSWSISNALAAYVTSLSSFNSPFDQYIRGDLDDISDEVKKGFDLFMGKAACGTCHFAPAFNGTVPPFYSDSESEVLGVTTGLDTLNPQLDHDPGRRASGLPRDEANHLLGSFKTVTVRNVALTAPYMHNGSFNTLEEVVSFYNHGGGSGLGLVVPNQTLPPDPLELSQSEQKAIVSFMNALTDTTGMTDKPSKYPSFPESAKIKDDRNRY